MASLLTGSSRRGGGTAPRLAAVLGQKNFKKHFVATSAAQGPRCRVGWYQVSRGEAPRGRVRGGARPPARSAGAARGPGGAACALRGEGSWGTCESPGRLNSSCVGSGAGSSPRRGPGMARGASELVLLVRAGLAIRSRPAWRAGCPARCGELAAVRWPRSSSSVGSWSHRAAATARSSKLCGGELPRRGRRRVSFTCQPGTRHSSAKRRVSLEVTPEICL